MDRLGAAFPSWPGRAGVRGHMPGLQKGPTTLPKVLACSRGGHHTALALHGLLPSSHHKGAKAHRWLQCSPIFHQCSLVLRAGDRQACSPLPTHRSLTPPQKSLLLREKSPRSLATEESARTKRSLNSQSNQNYFSKQYPVTS